MDKMIRTAFDAVSASDRFKENVRSKTLQSMPAPSPNKAVRIRRPLAACACLAVLFIGILTLYCIPVAAIEVENAPAATQIKINCFNRVVSVDGSATDENLQHRHYREAIDCLLTQNEDAKDTVITVIGNNRVLTDVENRVENNTDVCCYKADRQTAEQAADCGLSVAKYVIYQQLLTNGEQITPEEVHHTGMHHLRERLAQSEESTDANNADVTEPVSECHTQADCDTIGHNAQNRHHAAEKQHGKNK